MLDPDLDKYRRMDPRAIVDAAVDTIAGGVPDDIRADYLDCYDGDRFVESMRYVRRYPEELPELAELLPQITTPVTIINGRHDRVVPLANAEFLDERLPNSRLRRHRRRPLRLGGGAGGVRRRSSSTRSRQRRGSERMEVGTMPKEPDGAARFADAHGDRTGRAVLFAEISAPPMNLLGPELVRDLVSLIERAEADEPSRCSCSRAPILTTSSRTST